LKNWWRYGWMKFVTLLLEESKTVKINLILYRCSPWCNHMDNFFVSYYFIYLIAQLVPHWWGMFFTQQTSCLPYFFLIHSSWYIGIYTVDTLLYSLCFTNCIILFLPPLSYHSQVFTWVLQPELLLKVITKATWWTTLSAVVQTIVEREQSDLIDNTICCCIDCCRKGA